MIKRLQFYIFSGKGINSIKRHEPMDRRAGVYTDYLLRLGLEHNLCDDVLLFGDAFNAGLWRGVTFLAVPLLQIPVAQIL